MQERCLTIYMQLLYKSGKNLKGVLKYEYAEKVSNYLQCYNVIKISKKEN